MATITATRQTKTTRTGRTSHIHTVMVDGQVVATRKSATNAYTHAIVVSDPTGDYRVYRYSGSAINAAKAADDRRSWAEDGVVVQVVEITEVA